MPQSKVRDIKEDLYEPFVSCVEKARLCGDYRLALTHNTVDEGDPTKDRVNAGLFLKQDVPSDEQPHWASQVLWIEFKRQSPREKDDVDPFDSEPEGPVGIWDIRPKLRKQGRAQLQSPLRLRANYSLG
ncbi:hypothetical protein A0H81_11026 [Grifola frondosa]|uniref:Uncharacterized protein n=1 Tax=Grifola frondosa TaxID=5627 RepID=A0A1C7LYB4_GRIFR|nr:hypothetical protein A0H81_11026 [Grifola frondosa]